MYEEVPGALLEIILGDNYDTRNEIRMINLSTRFSHNYLTIIAIMRALLKKAKTDVELFIQRHMKRGSNRVFGSRILLFMP